MGCGSCWCFSSIVKVGMAVMEGAKVAEKSLKRRWDKDAGILKFVIFVLESNKSKMMAR